MYELQGLIILTLYPFLFLYCVYVNEYIACVRVCSFDSIIAISEISSFIIYCKMIYIYSWN